MRGKKGFAVKFIIIFVVIFVLIIGFSLYFCYNTYHAFPWSPYWENRINYTEIDKNVNKCREIGKNNNDLFTEIGSDAIRNNDNYILNSDKKQKLLELGFSENIANTTPGIVLFYYDYCPETDIGVCYIENMNDVQYFFGEPYYNTSPQRNVYCFEKINDNLYVYARIAEFH